MYQTLLTRKYLTSKIMPLLAAFAVMLCTAMVLIVWSVMGGFLNTLLLSGRTLIGDVTVNWPTVGFAYYDEFIGMLRKDPAVAGASPMIEAYGLVSLPNASVDGVIVKGIDPKTYPDVIDFADSLWWKPIGRPLPKDTKGEDPRLDPSMRARMQRALTDGLSLTSADPITGAPRPAIVAGIHVMGISDRRPEGFYDYRSKHSLKPMPNGGVASVQGFPADMRLNIRVLPMDSSGRAIDLTGHVFPVANEFRTGVYEIDKKTVLVPLSVLQDMLKMDEARTRKDGQPYNPYKLDTEPVEEIVTPARVTTVLIRAAEGVSSDALRDRVEEVYNQFAGKHMGQVPSVEQMRANRLIRTWEMTQARFIGAVKQETTLVLMMLGIISLTASALILAIFWAMVAEKTKDIGVLRSIGASRTGVAWVWLTYGLTIGVIGSVLGGSIACTIVWNINPIHEWIGRTIGVYVWDPAVYYFTEIPSKVETWKAVGVLASGVGFSVLGALIPALRAARLDPVKALRFE